MATYQFSTLSSGQAISFDPNVDVLQFDQTAISAANINHVSLDGAAVRIAVHSGPHAGKFVDLMGATAVNLAPSNIVFANGSRFLLGNGTPAPDALGADTIFGGSGADFVHGWSGNDSLNGGSGNDWLRGSQGFDTLTGSGGQDSFVFEERGGGEFDVVTDFASGWDNLQFNSFVFSGLGAPGRWAAGDVRFYAAAGASAAHDADDRLVFNTTTRELFYDHDGIGGEAAQLILRLSNTASITASDIYVHRPAGVDAPTPPPPPPPAINGTAGNDSIVGTAGNDTINGLGGDDTLVGVEGIDSLNGGDGNDVLDGRDEPYQGFIDPETLNGGAGNDVYWVDHAGDVLIDASGTDTVRVVNINWTLAAGFENLAVHDTRDASGLFLVANGNAGNNLIDARSGWGVQSNGGDGNDTILGSVQEDTLVGGTGNDSLDGDQDNDSIAGGAGNDTLSGGLFGFDTLQGGSGSDDFLLFRGEVDTVDDFTSATDTLVLDGFSFGGVGVSGRFAAGDARFHSGPGVATAHDASDRVIYDTTTGNLYFDSDGTGASLAELVATLLGPAVLVATDLVVVNGAAPGSTITGTSGNDSLTGTLGSDSISALAGNDTIDTVSVSDNPYRFTPQATDTVDGGTGDDVYFVWGLDTLVDAGGLDRVVVTFSGTYDLPEGFENVRIARGADTDDFLEVNGNGAGNVILGNWTRLTLNGEGGNDRIYSDFYRDVLNGGDGDDWLHGGGDNDTLTGGAGADHFVFDEIAMEGEEDLVTDFTPGVDRLHVDARVMPNAATLVTYSGGQLSYDGIVIATLQGAPILAAGDIVIENGGIPGAVVFGDGFFEGTQYNDTMTGSSFADFIDGRLGNDSIAAGDGDDVIVGNEGNDTLLGGAGNDTFDLPWTFPNTNSSGTDVIDGGTGFDTVRFNFAGTATSGIVVNLAAGTVTGGSPGGSATLTSIEGADGTSFADSMLGGAGGNRLFGEEGADTLNGGAGNDTLTGGGGADAFILANAPGAANEDLITDFTSGVDKLRLDGSVMTALGGSGNFSAGDARFFAGAGASSGQDASDRVIYNTSTQELFYDADGSGGGASLLIARLQNPSGPVVLQATDIAVDNGSVAPPPPPPGVSIFSGSGNDSLTGTAGNDTINGGGGNDSIAGGAGNDSVSGSGGQDTFVFREAGTANADRVTDFASNWDRFFLDNAGLTALGAEGRFVSGDARFWAAAGANAGHDANDRVVYNTTTGQLWYDADGSGAGAAELLATLTNLGNVVATDITVI